jgi:hypothetical protein
VRLILGEEERVLEAVVVACRATRVHPLVLPQSVYVHDRHMLEVGVLEVESVELEGYLLIIPTLGVSGRPSRLLIPVHQLDRVCGMRTYS